MSNRHPHTLPQVTAQSAAAVLGTGWQVPELVIVLPARPGIGQARPVEFEVRTQADGEL